MARTKAVIPPYRIHKGTGQGYVNLDGERVYLGKADDPATRKRYDRTVAEWLSAGRRRAVAADDITIVEIVNAWRKHAEVYYGVNSAKELGNYRLTWRPLLELYESLPAKDFGPIQLKAIRQKYIDSGWCRKMVNKSVGRMRRIFRWAASESMISADVFVRLGTVEGLKIGRSAAHESDGYESP